MQTPADAGNCGAVLAISAVASSVSSGTVVFSNSNNVSFGMSGSTITASAGAAGGGGVAISAGSQSVSTGTVSFANSNGITFGMSGSSRITASFNQTDVSYSVFQPTEYLVWTNGQHGQASLAIHPVTAPNVVFSQIGMNVIFSGSTNATATVSYTFNFGIYTRAVSSISLVSSTSFSGTINHSGTVNGSLYNGQRMVTAPWTSTLTKGDYWIGIQSSTTFAGTNSISFSQVIATQIASIFSGILGNASAATAQASLGLGYYSATTGAMPTSIGFSEITGTLQFGMRPPIYQLAVSV